MTSLIDQRLTDDPFAFVANSLSSGPHWAPSVSAGSIVGCHRRVLGWPFKIQNNRLNGLFELNRTGRNIMREERQKGDKTTQEEESNLKRRDVLGRVAAAARGKTGHGNI